MPDGVPLIYVETCSIIDLVKIKRGIALKESEEETKKRIADVDMLKGLCAAGLDGAVQLFTSTLTVAECQYAGDETADGIPLRETMDLLHDFLMSGQFIKLIEADVFVAERARDLRWSHGICLKGADSVHVASALSAGCREFLTTDRKAYATEKFDQARPKLQKLGLRVIRASETAHLPHEYKTKDLFEG